MYMYIILYITFKTVETIFFTESFSDSQQATQLSTSRGKWAMKRSEFKSHSLLCRLSCTVSQAVRSWASTKLGCWSCRACHKNHRIIIIVKCIYMYT